METQRKRRSDWKGERVLVGYRVVPEVARSIRMQAEREGKSPSQIVQEIILRHGKVTP